MKTGEQFECRNCHHVGDLDLHGGCECCSSQAVVSLEVISLVTASAMTGTNDPNFTFRKAYAVA